MPDTPLIDEELASFLQGGVSITAGSRGPDLVPDSSRGIGCRVSGDRRRVTVFFLASQSEGLLAGLRDNGAIAVVFSYPPTLRTVQLKGQVAEIGALEEGDPAIVARYRAAFRESLVSVRYEPGLPETLLAGPLADLVAVAFTPAAAFVQTPGPVAGKPLARER